MTRIGWPATTALIAFVAPIALATLSCGDASRSDAASADADSAADTIDHVVEDPTTGPPGPDSVSVFFTRDEAPVERRRAVQAGPAGLRAAVEALLAGPTEAERAQGIGSWFSPETVGMLRSVEVDGSHAVVDFADLRAVIPNASTSTGSMLLLQELNATVFQFPELHSVEYRIDGSCDVFWEWLQYGCHTVQRDEER